MGNQFPLITASIAMEVSPSSGEIIVPVENNEVPQIQITSELIAVDAEDNNPDYLINKIIAGENIIITENNIGGNENLEISTNIPAGKFEQPTNKNIAGGYVGVDSNDKIHALDGSQLINIPKDSTKADKVSTPTVGDFAGLDSNGNLTDSGKNSTSFQSPIGYTPENITNKSTDTTLGGLTPSDIKYPSQKSTKTYVDNNIPVITGKADKVNSPTAGNFAGLDSNGNLTDSGKNSSSFQSPIGFTPENSANKNQDNGYAGLDGSGKVSTDQLPSSILGALDYQGTYDASGNIYPLNPAKGYYWIISKAGTLGGIGFGIGDWLTYDGSSWDRIDQQKDSTKADKVSSPTIGDFAGLDSNGNLTDSGYNAGNFIQTSEINEANGIVGIDANGKIHALDGSQLTNMPAGEDEKIKISETDTLPDFLYNKLIDGNNINLIKNSTYGVETITVSAISDSTKADKVSSPTAGDFASLDSNGNLVDSGKTSSSFQSPLGYTAENTANKNQTNGYVGIDANGKIHSLDGSQLTNLPLDEKVKVSTTDTLPDYLFNKLVDGTNINIIKNSTYGVEYVTISASSDSTKADKIIPVTSGNLAGLNAGGDLTDSGYNPNYFTNYAIAMAMAL